MRRLMLIPAATAAVTVPAFSQTVLAPKGAEFEARLDQELNTSAKAFEPEKHLFRDAGLVIGGAVVGHHVSKTTRKKGGTLAGAAAGFAVATNLKSDIDVKRGTIVHFKLNDDLAASS